MVRKLLGRSVPTAQISIFVRSIHPAHSACTEACELVGIPAECLKQDGRDSNGNWEDKEGSAATIAGGAAAAAGGLNNRKPSSHAIVPHHSRLHAALSCFSTANRISNNGLLGDSSASDSSPEPTCHPPTTTALVTPQNGSADASRATSAWPRNAFPDWSVLPPEEVAVSSLPPQSSWKKGVRHLLPGKQARERRDSKGGELGERARRGAGMKGGKPSPKAGRVEKQRQGQQQQLHAVGLMEATAELQLFEVGGATELVATGETRVHCKVVSDGARCDR